MPPRKKSMTGIQRNKETIVIETKQMPVKDLHVFHKNPRVGNIEAVQKSLHMNGQFKPIVVNVGTHTKRPFEILAGNHTYIAARRELTWQVNDKGVMKEMHKPAYDTILVSLVDVDDDAANKIVLADNKTADNSTYDDSILADIFKQIDLADAESTGYSADEMSNVMADAQRALEASTPKGLLDNVLSDADQLLAGNDVDDEDGDERSGREKYLDGQDDDKKASAEARGIDVAEPVEDEEELDEVEEVRVSEVEELQIVLELKEDEVYCGSGRYGLPDLMPDRILKKFPEPLGTWGGQEATPDDGKKYFLYNYSLGGLRGLPFDRTILAFNCVDTKTEALTQRGWLRYDAITEDDTILSMDPDTGDLHWSAIRSIFRKHYTGKMFHLSGSAMDALVTPDHKFATVDGQLVKVQNLKAADNIRTMGNALYETGVTYTDDFVAVVGWAAAEGSYRIGKTNHGVNISQKIGSEGYRKIRKSLDAVGAEYNLHETGTNCYMCITGSVANDIVSIAPNRVLSMDFILSLSTSQRELLLETMLDSDGWCIGRKAQQYFQEDLAHIEALEALCNLQGIATTRVYRQWIKESNGTPFLSKGYLLTLKQRKTAWVHALDWHGGRGDARKQDAHQPTVEYDDVVWCPQTDYGTWVCRRNGKTFVTGNTYDPKFVSWWETPAYLTARMMDRGLRMAVVPDFSYYSSETPAHHLWGAYRAQWIGRFFQEAGLQVVPRLQFDYTRKNSLEMALEGIPRNTPTLESSCQNTKDLSLEERANYIAMLREALQELKPKQTLIYAGNPGWQIFKETGWKGQAFHAMNYAGVRRDVMYGNKTGNTTKITKKQREAIIRKHGGDPDAKEQAVDPDEGDL